MTTQEKYNKYKNLDPFPEISPALLNSADIIDYVKTTGMIDPFYEDNKYLKPATYSLRLLGDYVCWDGNGEKFEGEIKLGKKFTLEKDSIAFVSLEPTIRLPYYIAARFNLKINNVYRGLLLGTGPLVDPGFEGRLSIPLHNLTTNPYTLKGGEQLIWMEFTKLTLNRAWKGDLEEVQRVGRYYPFPEDKKYQSLSTLIDDAESQRPIRSTIPDVFSRVEKAEKLTSRGNIYNIVTIFTILSLIIGLIFAIISLNNDYKDRFNLYQDTIMNLNEEIIDNNRRIMELENNIEELNDQ